MRFLLLMAAIVLMHLPAKAQTDSTASDMYMRGAVKSSAYRKLYWLGNAGANLSRIGGDADSVLNKVGLMIGAAVGYDLNERLSLQGGLAFNGQGGRIDSNWPYIGIAQGSGSAFNAIYSYVSMPLAVQVYPSTKHGFFAEGGLQPSLLLKAEVTGVGGDFAATKSRINIKDRMNAFDMAGTIGLGYAWPEGLDVRLKYIYGFMNTIDSGKAGTVSGNFLNRTIQMSLGYRFR